MATNTNHIGFFAIASILVLTNVLLYLISSRQVPVVVRTNLERLPYQVGSYLGQDDFFSKSVYDELQADRHVYRHYRSKLDQNIDLYIGYYGTAKGGRTPHNPYGCLPGSGWAIVKNDTVTIAPGYASNGVRLNLIISQKNDVYNVMMHWYQSAGTKVLSSGFEQNWQRYLGRIVDNRNDGAYIQVSSFADERNLSKVKDALSEFSLQILELLPRYWPEEQ